MADFLRPDFATADPGRFLVEGRARVHDFHQGTERWGSRTCNLYSAVVDNTLRALHERARIVRPGDASFLQDEFCLVAVGGYARRALCPFSDVDVALVSRRPDDDRLEAAGRDVLYPLWDAGLQVGQRPGTPEQLVASAEDDVAARTALLDLRFVTGSRALYEDLERRVAEAQRRWAPELLARVRPENLARFARYGQSVFLLEPHVKEGKGALRDFHWLGWITKLSHGLRGDYDLLLSGLVEPEHYRQLTEAHEFLLRTRTQLHLHTGRAQDKLVFEAQEPVARALGFSRRKGLLGVERFMGAYYRQAYTMAHLCGLYVARILGVHWDEPEEAEVHTVRLEVGPSAPVAGAGEGSGEHPERPFVVEGGDVRCTDPDALGRSPGVLMELFAFLQSVGGRLHHDTMEHVRTASARIGKRVRSDPDMAAAFRALLEGPRVFRTLVAMHRSGFLGKYLPEFGACFCQAQHNRVHLYTVDVHSLYVVRELEALGGDHAPEGPFADAWRALEERGPLLLAGLLHDVAKAHGAAHSRVGADVAGVVLRRLGYDSERVERVQWLVRHHLLLSDTAYHRDLYDARTVTDMVAVVRDRAHLDELAVLTWADTRATNPALMTSWKETLLRQAWAVARDALDPDATVGPAPREALRARLEALLSSEVGRKHAEELTRRVLASEDALPGYLDRTPPEILAVHAILLDQLETAEEHAEASPVLTHVRQLPDQGVTQWIACTRDRVGVFGLLAGVLTASGLSIRAAEALSRADGVAVDTFAVVDDRGRIVDEPRRWRRVERLLRRVEAGEVDLAEAVDQARSAAPPSPDPGALGLMRVEVSNELSDVATVVEVVTVDRPGLVYDIAQVLLDFGLDLRVAKLATRHDLASDTFYVVGRRGERLGARRRARLAAALRERFC